MKQISKIKYNLITDRMYESPTLDMANTFANTANLMLCSIFYQPLFPLAIPIATLGLACQYWTFKVNFFQ
jgi:hypothetical protein